MSRLTAVTVRARIADGESGSGITHPVSTIVESIAAHGLEVGVTFVSEGGSEHREPIASLHDLPRLLADRTGYFTASDRDLSEPSRSALTLWIEAGCVELSLHVGGDAFHQRRERLMDDALGFLTALHGELGPAGKLGLVVSVGVGDQVAFPRRRPPRYHRLWSQRNVADVVSRRYHAEESGGEPAHVDQMMRAPMPEHTTRLELGDLGILRWVRDFTDEAAVIRALSVRSEWFARVLDLPIDDEFNVVGDQRLLRQARPYGPLLHYNPSKQSGYVALLASTTGVLDDERFLRACAWIRDGALPDGSPLRALRAVVPVREVALALHEPLVAAGFDRVAFPDDDGVLWDPCPPGPWLPES